MAGKTFVLDSKANADRLWHELKGWKERANKKPLVVNVMEMAKNPTNAQRKHYWATLTEIAEKAWIEGRKYEKEHWHELFKQQFLGKRISSQSLNTVQYEAYVISIITFAVNQLNIEFDEN